VGGTLTCGCVVSRGAGEYRLSVGVGKTGGERDDRLGALLGPEGTSAPDDGVALWREVVQGVVAPNGPHQGPVVRGGVRGESGGMSCPYFENCTVDASIFVAKLIRAHGGCLGIRSR
jgi:hypothetical protein